MKITNESLKKYAKVNENGFKVNIYTLLNQFSHGDEYPQLTKVIYNDDEKQIHITVSYFKFYGGSAEYRINAEEYKKEKDSNFMIGGSGYYDKAIFTEKIETGKFNFNHLKELCYKVNDEIIKEILNKCPKVNTKEVISLEELCSMGG